MRGTEQLTHRGTGFWRVPQRVTLATRASHYTERYGPRRLTQEAFLLHFEPVGAALKVPSWGDGTREFATETERSTFIYSAFSALALTAVTDASPRPVQSTLTLLEGAELESVEFVGDYLSLTFGRAHLHLYAWPVLRRDDRVWHPAEAEYRDALCDLLDRRLTSVDEYLDVGLALDFADGSQLEVDLRATGAVPAEVAVLAVEGMVLGVWQSGEPPYV